MGGILWSQSHSTKKHRFLSPLKRWFGISWPLISVLFLLPTGSPFCKDDGKLMLKSSEPTFRYFCPGMTLTAKSVSRLSVLLLERSYRQIATLSREHLVQSYWSLGLSRYRQYRNFLIHFRWMQNNLVVENNSICLLLLFYIFLNLQDHQTRVHKHSQQNRDNQYHLLHTKSSALWLHLVIAFCYLPKAFDVPIRVTNTEL